MTSWSKDRVDLEVFGTDSAMYYKYWNSGSGWSGYESMGGVFIFQPCAISLPSKKIHLFGIGGDSALYHKYYDPSTGWNPGPGVGAGWTSLGGVCMTAPVVVKYGDDNVAAFVIGTDRAAWVCMSSGAASFKWVALKGKFTGDSLTAASWANGRIDVFGIGTDSALWHLWYLDGNWSTSWENVGGVCIGKPKAISPREGRLDIFVKGVDSAMYQLNWNGKWNWQGLGGVHQFEPDAVCWNNGRIDVFSVSTDTNLIHVYCDISANNDPGTFNGNWEKLGGTCTGSPKALSRAEGILDVFIKGTKQQVLQKYYSGGWGPSSGGLGDLGGVCSSNPT